MHKKQISRILRVLDPADFIQVLFLRLLPYAWIIH